ncbi:hypothetical protein M885DRAFT_530321 [Pelagophyceae sp. CCMP2097]|nr:hypothetical protein M885DRAFT_530321 [Pelagophyceae sp. CCMP2097]
MHRPPAISSRRDRASQSRALKMAAGRPRTRCCHQTTGRHPRGTRARSRPGTPRPPPPSHRREELRKPRRRDLKSASSGDARGPVKVRRDLIVASKRCGPARASPKPHWPPAEAPPGPQGRAIHRFRFDRGGASRPRGQSDVDTRPSAAAPRPAQ